MRIGLSVILFADLVIAVSAHLNSMEMLKVSMVFYMIGQMIISTGYWENIKKNK